ncbi:MAG: acyltransferase family protein [Lachnospiraceae bacterium]|nr:acyltransferase family protein [Lachnospiraceae bacterium]
MEAELVNEENGTRDRSAARQCGPDLVRTIACVFVVGAHFYLNIGYYNEPMNGPKMFVMTGLRWLFVTAVPLFFMLTGYFKSRKKADRLHYFALIPLLISYVVISVAKMLLYNRLYGKIYDLRGIFKNLGNYQIAWFMGLYLCLFLLIPFLNKMWYALDMREQNILIVTLVFLCCLYPVFNYIAPSYFTGIYPVLFYFLGIAVRDRRWRPDRRVLLLVLVIIVVLEAFISMRFTSTGLFDWNLISTADGTYGTLFISICTVCIFLLFYDVKTLPGIIPAVLASISRVSFEIYLFAGAYDAIIYSYVKRYVSSATEGFWWFCLTVPLSFICAYISSVIFTKIVGIVLNLTGLFHDR